MKKLLICLICFCVTLAAFAQTNTTTAALPTFASKSITLHDSVRNKDLPLRVTYPIAGGKFPVIVFSHGAGGSGDGYLGLTQHWAANGYICLQPTHEDSVQLRRQAGERITSIWDVLEDADQPERWTSRIKDIELILDSLDQIDRQVPEIKGRMDRAHIGVGGHSLGALTAALVGGATIQMPNLKGLQSFKDDRARAILLLSPQGPFANGFTNDSWKEMRSPTMVMTGSRDRGSAGQDADWRTAAFKFSPAGDKYLLFIHDASHMSFSGRLAEGKGLFGRPAPKSDIDEGAIFDWVKTASLAFWDCYLKNDKEAQDFLKSDSLAKDSGGEIRYERR